MGKILAAASMSLHGYIALPDNTVGACSTGTKSATSPSPGQILIGSSTTRASSDYIENEWSKVGVSIIGRTLFDFVNGWNGIPPVGDRVIVLTHNPPTDWPFPAAPFTFVREGFAAALAIARDKAGDKDIVVNAGTIAGQALTAGVLDEVHVSLARSCGEPASTSSATAPGRSRS